MKILVIGLWVFSSCSMSKPVIKTKTILITLTKTQCSSYEVKNSGELIGYVVKPFVVDVEKKDALITQFENLLKTNYSSYYNKFYRTYWFIKNSASDTLIEVVMLSHKQISSIPNWQCEEQDVDTYKRNRKGLFDAAHPQFISYNCSKGRFKILGDPD